MWERAQTMHHFFLTPPTRQHVHISVSAYSIDVKHTSTHILQHSHANAHAHAHAQAAWGEEQGRLEARGPGMRGRCR